MRRLFAIVVSCILLAGCGGHSAGSAVGAVPAIPAIQSMHVAPNGDPNELPEPPEVDAVNGVATVSLVTDINFATGFPAFDYNGQHNVAPTIRVKPGDTIVIDLENNLPSGHGYKDDMNIHFHGIGTSPRRPADDVLTMLAQPGGTLHYVVPIPLNQEPGLYWYHPHVHGHTNYQVGQAGMSGAIIVQGLEHHIPGLGKMVERLMIVRDTGPSTTLGPNSDDDGATGSASTNGMPSMDDMSSMDEGSQSSTVRPHDTNLHPCGPDPNLTVELNGAVHPDITIKPGEQQFFRLINATGHKTLKLEVDGGTLEVVAIDGFALDSYPGTPPTMTVPLLIVPPAARAEFVVTGPANGRAKFRTACYDTGPNGDPDPMALLGNIVAPAGHFSRPIVHRPLTVGAPLPQNVYTTSLPPPAVKRTVIFSETPNHFFINGKRFSMQDPPMYVVHTGTVEQWRVINTTREIHDFHIHQIHFLVLSIDGKKVAHPYWQDSAVIPHRRGVGANGPPGNLVMLMDFRDHVIHGTFLFHCHILDHEDNGMMAKIKAI
jgi:suppressor of ftsI